MVVGGEIEMLDDTKREVGKRVKYLPDVPWKFGSS